MTVFVAQAKDANPRSRFGDFCIERGWVRECKASPSQGRAREPAITFHMSKLKGDAMVEEIGQLVDRNVDGMRDTMANNFGIRDFHAMKW